MRRRIAIITIAIALCATAAIAQAPAAPVTLVDTLPFRTGQWAAQFVAGTQFISAGVLHFRSPTSAWLLNGSFRVSRSSASTTGVANDQTNWDGAGTLRLGVRHFRPLGASANFFTTFGGLVSGGAGSLNGGGGLTTDSWHWGIGAFGELGANYMLTPRFSLGAAAGVEVRYDQQYSKGTSSLGAYSSTFDVFSVSGALLSLNVGVYF